MIFQAKLTEKDWEMGSISCYSWFIFLAIFSRSCFIFQVACDNAVTVSEREASEIIIGGGGGYSPEIQDSSPPPPPSSYCGLPPNLIRDYNTIQKFKDTITCDPQGITKTWIVQNVCEYKGFACDRRPDKPDRLSLAALDFNGYNLNGPNLQIKDLLDQLEDLAIFHVNSNRFTGTFPDDIGVDKINFLYELDLSNNDYSGLFPRTVLAAKNLTFLDIRFNSFFGSVPGEAFELDLDVLFLNNNKFTSTIPDNIGKTPALYLTFANNYFVGPIPSSIGSAKNLREVLFLNNSLSGCLPYEIGFLTNLTLFDASHNNLTGPIPHSFGCLAMIEILNLAKNYFYGAVPEMLCKLPNLRNLTLSINYFTQVGPECRKLIRLKRLDVRKNCILDLPEQRSPEDCRNFFSKHRQCPNERSMREIPCLNNGYLSSKQKVDDHHHHHRHRHRHRHHHHQPLVAASPPKTYDALSPDYKLRLKK